MAYIGAQRRRWRSVGSRRCELAGPVDDRTVGTTVRVGRTQLRNAVRHDHCGRGEGVNYLALIMGVIHILEWMIETGQRWKWMEEGAQEVIAKSMAEIIRKSGYAKQALIKFTGMSESAVDDFLRGLEPGEDGDGQSLSGVHPSDSAEGRQQDQSPKAG